MSDDQGAAATAGSQQAMLQAAEAYWQLPAILFTGWWNWTAPFWLPHAAHPLRSHSAGHRLVVPEPLEETGERALFA